MGNRPMSERAVGPEREGRGESSMPGLGENYGHRFGAQFDSFRELPEPHASGDAFDPNWDGRPELREVPGIVGADLDDYEPVGESTRRANTGWRDRTGFSGTNEAAYLGHSPEFGPGSEQWAADGTGMGPRRHHGTVTRDDYYRIDANEDAARRERMNPRR